MRYCYNCNRVTIGDPLFCNFCGRSYNIKLCPKLHVNPRNAEACSRCGNRDLSMPQPKVPFWATFLLVVLSLIPGLILAVFSIFAITFFIKHFLNTPDMLLPLTIMQMVLVLLCSCGTAIPRSPCNALHKILQ